MRLTKMTCALILACSLTLNTAQGSTPTPHEDRELQQLQAFGEKCLSLPGVLFHNILNFLLGDDHRVHYKIHPEDFESWIELDKVAVGNHGRIIMHRGNFVYSGYPHKPSWKPDIMKIPSGWNVVSVKDGVIFMGLPDKTTPRLRVFDDATFKQCAEFQVDPNSMFHITHDRQSLLHAANPLLTKDVVRTLYVTTHSPHQSTKPITTTKKIIAPKGGVMPPFAIAKAHDGTIFVAAHAAEFDGVYIFTTTSHKPVSTISISDRGLTDKVGRIEPCEWLLPHPVTQQMNQFSLGYNQFINALLASVLPHNPLYKNRPRVPKHFMRRKASTISLTFVQHAAEKLPYLLSISQEQTTESSIDDKPIIQQQVHATYWDITEKIPLRTHSTTVQDNYTFTCATTAQGSVMLPTTSGYERASHNASLHPLVNTNRNTHFLTGEMLLTSPSGDYTLLREHVIETVAQKKRGYVLRPITMTYYGMKKKRQPSALYHKYMMHMFAFQQDADRGNYIRLPKGLR